MVFALPNLWAGITVCNQQEADEKIPILLDTPAAHRWLSYEPALGPLELLHHGSFTPCFGQNGIEWVVSGSESGPGRRPTPHDNFRSLRDQCVDAGVDYFLKQMGANEDGSGKVVKMPELDGRVWDQMPEAMVEVLESAERSA